MHMINKRRVRWLVAKRCGRAGKILQQTFRNRCMRLSPTHFCSYRNFATEPRLCANNGISALQAQRDDDSAMVHDRIL